MSVKITAFEAENVKRVKAVSLEPKESGLTAIGGANGEGKTSVLDAIAWALGGNAYRPSEPGRRGSALPPAIKVELSNGLVVERKGRSSALTVTDPSGQKAGQKLLDSFVSEFALNLPKFMELSAKEKAKGLLAAIGADKELARLEAEESRLAEERLLAGRDLKKLAALAEGLPWHKEAEGKGKASPDSLIAAQQEIFRKNAKIQEARAGAERLKARAALIRQKLAAASERIAELARQKKELEGELAAALREAGEAETAAGELPKEESAEALRAQIEEAAALNAKIGENEKKLAAAKEAEKAESAYAELERKIGEARAAKRALLEGARFPLPGLSVEDGELTLHGDRWDAMSGSSQLVAAAAVAKALRPECGFVLVDKLEQMDPITLAAFGRWAEGEGLQIIGTRVTADASECAIIIEDGTALWPSSGGNQAPAAPKFTAGEF